MSRLLVNYINSVRIGFKEARRFNGQNCQQLKTASLRALTVLDIMATPFCPGGRIIQEIKKDKIVKSTAEEFKQRIQGLNLSIAEREQTSNMINSLKKANSPEFFKFALTCDNGWAAAFAANVLGNLADDWSLNLLIEIYSLPYKPHNSSYIFYGLGQAANRRFAQALYILLQGKQEQIQ